LPTPPDPPKGETRKQAAQRKRQLAGSLWLRGRSFRAVAEEGNLGNPGNAHRLVQQYLEQTGELGSVAQQRKIENARLDEVWAMAFERAEQTGDVAFLRVLVDISRRRSALNGLDKPTVIQLDNPPGDTQHTPGPSLAELLPADQFAEIRSIREQALLLHRALPPSASNGQAS
jgi:hypothetical protein